MPTAALAVTEDTADSTVVWLQATPDWYAWFLGEREYTSTVSIAVLAAAGLLSTELASDSSESTGIVLVLLNGNATEPTSDTTADGGYVTVFASADVIEGRDTATAQVITDRPQPAASGGRRMRQQKLEWLPWPVFGPEEARRLKRRRQELLLLTA